MAWFSNPPIFVVASNPSPRFPLQKQEDSRRIRPLAHTEVSGIGQGHFMVDIRKGKSGAHLFQCSRLLECLLRCQGLGKWQEELSFPSQKPIRKKPAHTLSKSSACQRSWSGVVFCFVSFHFLHGSCTYTLILCFQHSQHKRKD